MTAFNAFLQSDFVYGFTRSPIALTSFSLTVLFVLAALFAPLIAPHDPFNPATLSLMDASLPPAWAAGGDARYLFGTDDQGRDILSTLLYGARISLLVGFCAVALSVGLGVSLGLIAGFLGGWVEAVLMRIADIQLTIPGLLVALLIDGIARSVLPGTSREDFAMLIIIFAIGISDWPQFARLARSGALSERSKDYVSAARLVGAPNWFIATRHIFPNITGPIIVVATISIALAIMAEATLSFLGVGMPPTTPSLGTMIRTGMNFLFAREWWMTFFPAFFLVLLVLSVNVFGDWLKDALNPRLEP